LPPVEIDAGGDGGTKAFIRIVSTVESIRRTQRNRSEMTNQVDFRQL
jgi:hypothetical protein